MWENETCVYWTKFQIASAPPPDVIMRMYIYMREEYVCIRMQYVYTNVLMSFESCPRGAFVDIILLVNTSTRIMQYVYTYMITPGGIR